MLEKVIENWTSRLDYIRASRDSPMPEIIFKMIRDKRGVGERSRDFVENNITIVEPLDLRMCNLASSRALGKIKFLVPFCQVPPSGVETERQKYIVAIGIPPIWYHTKKMIPTSGECTRSATVSFTIHRHIGN
ncbi:hypothetical protein TNCV_1816681 [Trichonephila clavipes]|nr:hypothetical protein TNCV_1816681 [Trichonephila clavipes]